MIKIEKVETFGWESAIRGMRNPMNSWDKSDTQYGSYYENENIFITYPFEFPSIGENDLKLMNQLSKAGNDHAKFLRMINVTFDITAPLYWWKEFDTYKIGTVANSCSTMHKIADKEFALDDFSHEHLDYDGIACLTELIEFLNFYRDKYNSDFLIWHGMNKKDFWWQMIQLLPSSYNQKRTIQLNYQVLKNIYPARKYHKLDEWKDFCDFIKRLPYSNELIILEE